MAKQLQLFDTNHLIVKLPSRNWKVPSNFFHGKWYRGDDGKSHTYKSNPRNLSTIEMIRKGIRTQTSRANVAWRVGDTLTFIDAGISKGKDGQISNTGGQSVLVEITEVYPISEIRFNLYEGWDNTVWDNRKQQLKNYISYKFKII